MKLLTIDIETSPNLADVWGLWQQNVGLAQLKEAQRMLCFAAKWWGKKRTNFRSEYLDGTEYMVESAWQLLNEADAVIGYNSQGYDVKHLNREFIQLGLGPPSPFKNIDLFRVVKANFKFPSYKLDYVAGVLLGEKKLDTGGHELWTQVMKDNRKAWKTMQSYNIRDVDLTERLYERLLPWIRNHPNHNLWSPTDEKVCANCGSSHIVKDGFYYTNVGKYQQYRCQGCGAWGRGRESLRRGDDRIDIRGVR